MYIFILCGFSGQLNVLFIVSESNKRKQKYYAILIIL